MADNRKEVYLVNSNFNLNNKIKHHLDNHFLLKNITDDENGFSNIQQRNILCLIACLNETSGTSLQRLSLFIEQFPTIPIITIVDGNNFDLIFSCGKIGVNEILISTELDKLTEKISLLSHDKFCFCR